METTSLAPPPAAVRRNFDRLAGQRAALLSVRSHKVERLAQLTDYLALAPQVEDALKKLGQELFGALANLLEHHLTQALQEVLGQPITLRVGQEYKYGAATLKFFIQRNGADEDIMRGTGGSVANVLSVGLRPLALAQLDEAKHRRFLVLDEQDCWLAPDLVPHLVKIIHDAGKALKFQIIMISHHGSTTFERYADRIYRFSATPKGVEVERHDPRPATPDAK